MFLINFLFFSLRHCRYWGPGTCFKWWSPCREWRISRNIAASSVTANKRSVFFIYLVLLLNRIVFESWLVGLSQFWHFRFRFSAIPSLCKVYGEGGHLCLNTWFLFAEMILLLLISFYWKDRHSYRASKVHPNFLWVRVKVMIAFPHHFGYRGRRSNFDLPPVSLFLMRRFWT